MSVDPTYIAGGALLGFGATEFLLRRGAAARRLTASPADRGTTPLLLGCYALIALLLLFPMLPGPRIPPLLAVWGGWTAVAGLAFRWWAMVVLGRFYTRTLTTQGDQEVVRRGPYRWIRHPGYLGSLLTWVGAAVASRNLLVALVVGAGLLAAYMRRMTVEEQMLERALGPAYADYRLTTWRLLPLIY